MTSTPPGARQDHDPSRTTQLRIPPQLRTGGQRRRQKKALPRYDYEHYSRLAGPLTQPDPTRPYTVKYRSLLSQEPHRIRAALLLGAAPLVSLGLFAWLIQPEHWTQRDPNLKNDTLLILDIVMLVSIGLIELFRTLNVLSNAHATLVARDPVPVVPETGTRVAFLTSFVPGKEPLEMVTKTLEAAVRIRHRGLMHVWLLDEGDDPAVKEVCLRLGVHHFSRKGVAHWNQAKGPHRAKTKHGNYNAWLDAHGDAYDFFASVDTDHVPMPNYLERMLGYFRDPDVGFVIGPQVYGNYDSFVTKAAESQQFLFHALIQRAGQPLRRPDVRRHQQRGAHQCPQADRRSVRLDHRGHGDRLRDAPRPQPAHRPQVALGVHPGRAGRGRGTDRVDGLLHPAAALVAGHVRDDPQAVLEGLLLAARGQALQLHDDDHLLPDVRDELDPRGPQLRAVPGHGRLRCADRPDRLDDAVRQRIGPPDRPVHLEPPHNVSPHEPEGSGGLAGMMMSALSAPIYARSLMDAVLRRKSSFVVTPKGDSSSPDTLFGTFRIHLFFILVFAGSIVASFALGHSHPAMLTWAALALLITAAPIFGWRYTMRAEKKKRRAGPPPPSGPPAHGRQEKPHWAGDEQTMQIALGGRKQ